MRTTVHISLLSSLAFAALLVVVVVATTPRPLPMAYGEETITSTQTTGYAISVAEMGADATPPPAGAQYVVWRSTPWKKNSADPGDRTEIWQAAGGTATMAQMKNAAPSLLPRVLEEVQAIRRQALSRAVANAGVAEVYEQNYRAAVARIDGKGAVTAMKNGMTADQYLAGFAPLLGMTVDQFAAYIIAENQRVGPAAYAVEQEYLRVAYGQIPREIDLKKLLAYPADYRRYCGL